MLRKWNLHREPEIRVNLPTITNSLHRDWLRWSRSPQVEQIHACAGIDLEFLSKNFRKLGKTREPERTLLRLRG